MVNASDPAFRSCLGSAAEDDQSSLSDKASVAIVQGLMVALAFAAVLGMGHVRKRWAAAHNLPECGAVILVGFAVGGILHLVDPRFGKVAARFNADAFLLFILPPIIFDAGFTLTSSRGRITANTGTILALAIAGTLVSTVVVGSLLYLLFDVLLPSRSSVHISLWESYAFGALISAVDPVATLAVLTEVFPGSKPSMFYLVFGESVINDAVSIVLYNVCTEFLSNDSEVTLGSVGQAFLRFWGIFIGSLVIGVVFSVASAVFLRVVDLKSHPGIELISMLLTALSMYSISETLDLSGIMTIFIGGRLFKHWTAQNLSLANRIFFPKLAKALAECCELYVFAFLGAAFWSHPLVWNGGFIVATFVFILIGRAANVFPICWVSNKVRAVSASRAERITLREQAFMWFSGLRGAIAFALASDGAHRCTESGQTLLRHGDALVTSTLVIVMGTVFIFGGAAKPLLRVLSLTPEAMGVASPRRARAARVHRDSGDSEDFQQHRSGGGAPTSAQDLLLEDLFSGSPPSHTTPHMGSAEPIGAAFGPPPTQLEDGDQSGSFFRAWMHTRTRVWWCLARLLEMDTVYLKPLLCREPSTVEARRERFALALLDEERDHAWLERAQPSRRRQSQQMEAVEPAAAAEPASDPRGESPLTTLGGIRPPVEPAGAA